MPNCADRHAGIIVHAVDLADAEALHHAVVEHGLAAGAALLGRLEDHHRGAGEIARLGEIARGAEQHGGMAVMAAGVHLARHRRLVRQVVRLLDRQRVHVGAQPDRLVRMPPLRPWMTPTTPVRPMPGTTSSQPNALSLSATLAAVRCTSYMQFGMGVQIAPPGGDFAVQSATRLTIGMRTAPCAGNSVANCAGPMRVQQCRENRLLTGQPCAPNSARRMFPKHFERLSEKTRRLVTSA